MPSIIETNQVPAALKQEFYIYGVVHMQDDTIALKCFSEDDDLAFFLFMAGGDDDTPPSLHIKHWPTESEEPVTHPVYPFKVSDMPEKIQGMINIAEQWLDNLNM